jgi:hypothetical protein
MTWLAPSTQAGIAVTAMAGIGELGKFSAKLSIVARPQNHRRNMTVQSDTYVTKADLDC